MPNTSNYLNSAGRYSVTCGRTRQRILRAIATSKRPQQTVAAITLLLYFASKLYQFLHELQIAVLCSIMKSRHAIVVIVVFRANVCAELLCSKICGTCKQNNGRESLSTTLLIILFINKKRSVMTLSNNQITKHQPVVSLTKAEPLLLYAQRTFSLIECRDVTNLLQLLRKTIRKTIQHLLKYMVSVYSQCDFVLFRRIALFDLCDSRSKCFIRFASSV
jgi:hypothetical protein